MCVCGGGGELEGDIKCTFITWVMMKSLCKPHTWFVISVTAAPSSCPCVFTAEHTGGAGGTVEGLREEGDEHVLEHLLHPGPVHHQPF